MAAGKASYLIIWKKSSQVYSAASLATAINTPVPKGCEPEDKRIVLASFLPDDEMLCVYPLPQEQIDEKIAQIEFKEAEKAKAKQEGTEESDEE